MVGKSHDQVMQFELTPKALANFSPGFEEREPWEPSHQRGSNPERVRQPRNPFRVERFVWFDTRVVASSNPGLKLANAFGVNSNCITTTKAE